MQASCKKDTVTNYLIQIMKNLLLLSIIFLGTLLESNVLSAQRLDREEVDAYIKNMPGFSIHKDNYFVTGIPTNKHIDKTTADVKYQISFKQLITRNTLPLDTYLYVTYSQKAFWNIYENSSPFEEINFNPSIGLAKPIFNNKDKMVGMASLMFEHESNGRDSIFSRSWNNLHVQYATAIDSKTILKAKAWLPFMYKEGNPNLLDYIGLAEVTFIRELIPRKLSLEVMARKGLEWNWQGALRSRLFYNPFNSTNQYFMLEWFAGNAESLIDYQRFTSKIRIGYVIKTDEFDFLRSDTEINE